MFVSSPQPSPKEREPKLESYCLLFASRVRTLGFGWKAFNIAIRELEGCFFCCYLTPTLSEGEGTEAGELLFVEL
jgi:hypothetical protein